MGHSASKKSKINKNHNKQKMFIIGLSGGRNDLNLEGHVQVGYCSKTVKNYNPIEKTQDNSIENVEELKDFVILRVNMDYLSSVYYDPKRPEDLAVRNVCIKTLKRKDDSR